VLVVGAGGLGTSAAAHLAAAGVGTLGIADPDRVELSNLHRQLLHDRASLGRTKAASVRAALRHIAPGIAVETLEAHVDATNAAGLFSRYDFIVDATDNFASKFLINDVAVATGTPFSHAGVLGFLGQTLTVLPGRSACYRCIFTAPPAADAVPSCREAGILGPVAGIMGTIQAAQAVAYLSGTGGLLLDRLLTYDALGGRWRTVRVRPRHDCAACAGRAG
jgi:molybdopterin/thiamine biosynthesis adenylyltransferase